MKPYSVVYERSPRNWSAYVPDLPGCIATGATRDQVETRIREAITMHIEAMRDAGLPVPEPTTETGAVEISR